MEQNSKDIEKLNDNNLTQVSGGMKLFKNLKTIVKDKLMKKYTHAIAYGFKSPCLHSTKISDDKILKTNNDSE